MGSNIKKKCAYCFSRVIPDSLTCRVCGIDYSKDKSALSPFEKKIAYRARTLYTIGFLMIVGGLVGLFLFLPIIYLFDHKKIHEDFLFPLYVLSMPVLLMLMPVYGFFLRQYKKWCYPGGIILFGFLIFDTALEMQFIFSLFFMYVLYCIVSPPSRRIFYGG